MSDRFKFRAWHTRDKVMIDDLCMSQTAFNRDGANLFYDVFHSGWYEVMQSTGLRDKNNKLIFEGDVIIAIEAEDRGDGYMDDILAVVKWDNENAWFAYDAGGYDRTLCDFDLEVVGNIYENPELTTQINH